MGEAGDQLIEGQLAGHATAHRTHQPWFGRQRFQDRPLALKHLSAPACHHQQAAFQGFRPAAQHRGLQIGAVLSVDLLLKRLAFGNGQRAHAHHAAALEIAQLLQHLGASRAIAQHTDHRVAITGTIRQRADGLGSGLQQGLAFLWGAIPHLQAVALLQQPAADGSPQQASSKQCNAGHGARCDSDVTADAFPRTSSAEGMQLRRTFGEQ